MSQTIEFQPILLGSDINVYGMARSFHEEFGITSLALSASGLAPTKYSKIVEVQTHENFDHEETFIQVLRDFASKHKDDHKKYLLVACGDGYQGRDQAHHAPHADECSGILISKSCS